MAWAASLPGETFDFLTHSRGRRGREVIGSALAGPTGCSVDAFIAAFGMVAIAEIGDKTQLLSFMLAARYPGRQGAIIGGILAATLVNHACAAFVGDWVATHVSPDTMRWVLGAVFLAFAVWALFPDSLDRKARAPRYGAFVTTLVMFFIAEMGDKTQLATVALGARFDSLLLVTLGTTLGMMAANVPAVLVGEKLAQRVPLSSVRFVAAALFAIFGVLILADLGISVIVGRT